MTLGWPWSTYFTIMSNLVKLVFVLIVDPCRYQVSVYRTIGPLVYVLYSVIAILFSITSYINFTVGILVRKQSLWNKSPADIHLAPTLGKITTAWNVGQGHWVKVHAQKIGQDNYYARFHSRSYQCCRETHINSRLNIKFWPIRGAWNVGQGHKVMVCTLKVWQRQLLCNVSSSQLSILQRNTL